MPGTCDLAADIYQSSTGAHLPHYKASHANRILKKVLKIIGNPNDERYNAAPSAEDLPKSSKKPGRNGR